MRFVSLKLVGFRRFESAKLRTDAKIVALLGPNEAGKTSLLDALTLLSDQPHEVAEADLTRGASIASSDVVIEARFEIDAADRAKIPELDASPKPTWWVLQRRADSKFEKRLEPPIADPLPGARRGALEAINAVKKAAKGLGPDAIRSIDDLHDEVLTQLKETRGTNPEVGKKLIARVGEILAGERLPSLGSQAFASAVGAVTEAMAVHAADPPDARASNALWRRTPDFVKFDVACRDLRSTYDLSAERPSALENLAALADLDLLALAAEAKAGRKDAVMERLDAANRVLDEEIRRRWSQSSIEVRLETDGTILHVFVRDDGSKYTRIAERSDGLRAFVALIAFLGTKRRTHDAILLVDELETHLHYDAQADLVRMLTRQQIAQQVIYTTHSVGALPDDLGTGLRLVRPSGGGRSEVLNSFWTESRGLSHVFYAMGAATVALALSHRSLVLTEGGSDVVLLPSLIRDVTQREDLGYQIAPGLAEANVGALAALRNEGSNVAYVVDGDAAGAKITKLLVQAGVDGSEILALGGPSSGVVVEDLISAAIYVDAFNTELRRSHGEGHAYDVKDLPGVNRPAAIAKWCKSKGIDPPAKANVAYHIAEQALSESITETARRSVVVALDEALRGRLQPSGAAAH